MREALRFSVLGTMYMQIFMVYICSSEAILPIRFHPNKISRKVQFLKCMKCFVTGWHYGYADFSFSVYILI